ncbi:MAG: hypothetical protein C0617_14030 [Desulfuromonas sp.]|uniref:hypothetical protein n=1 Tax=Desulfuromonas sp. TaxID=892 RepID=UPI000CB6C8A4|nr:hypothetical protein [Desulfuromonas sp.]PLX82246.1 MAG: hypothetical protein C0617_14030 [Desulfuromonas sp.]
MKHLDPALTYYVDLQANSGSRLFGYEPMKVTTEGSLNVLSELVREDQTTQIDVVLSRKAGGDLFVFHPGDDTDLHVRWNRRGSVVIPGLGVE